MDITNKFVISSGADVNIVKSYGRVDSLTRKLHCGFFEREEG